jgi:hypothetical protein
LPRLFSIGSVRRTARPRARLAFAAVSARLGFGAGRFGANPMWLAVALSVAVPLALAAPSAEGRTVYTVAGGGSLRLPLGPTGHPWATDVGLSSSARVESLPDGSFLISDRSSDLFSGERSLWRVGLDGRIRLVRRGAGDFAVARDGTAFYMQAGVLFRLNPDGEPTRVAEGFSGWRPVDVNHQPFSQMAATSGGDVLFVVNGDRILRVRPSGTVEVAAGNGVRGSSGDGIPATDAALSSPGALEATIDGGFSFVDGGGRLRHVGPRGLIGTVARVPGDGGLAVGVHGGAVFADFETGLWRLTPSGKPDRLTFNRRIRVDAPRGGLLWGDGGRPANLLFDWGIADLEVTGGGGLLVVHSLGDPSEARVRLLASRRTRQPALAFRTTLPARRRVSFVVTQHAKVQLLIRGEGRTLRLRTEAGPGRGRFRLPRNLRQGGYELRLSAVTDSGARLARRRGILYATTLPIRMAKAVVMFDDDYRRIVTPRGIDAHVGPNNDSKPGRCRRFGRRRVDCESLLNVPGRDCFEIISTIVDRRGQVWAGRYGDEGECAGKFSRRPDWLEEGEWVEGPHWEDVPLFGETSIFGF